MQRRSPIIIFAVGVLLSGVAYPFLPDRVPIHWNFSEANFFVDKLWAVVIMPSLMLVSYAINRLIVKVETQKLNIAILISLLVLHIVIMLIGLNYKISIGLVTGIVAGCLIIFLAKNLKGVQPNHMYGLRTPWTLENEEVWIESNEYASKVMVKVGAAIIALSIIIPKYALLVVIILPIIGATISIVKSYDIHKSKR